MFGAQHALTEDERAQTGVGVGVVVLVSQVHSHYRAGATSPRAQTKRQGSCFNEIYFCGWGWLI